MKYVYIVISTQFKLPYIVGTYATAREAKAGKKRIPSLDPKQMYIAKHKVTGWSAQVNGCWYPSTPTATH